MNTADSAREPSDRLEFGGTFEEAVQRLESIVRRLESDSTSLDDSLQLFEEGVKLSRHCARQLDEAEKKVVLLMEEREGSFTTTPFEVEKAEDTR